MKRKYTVLGIVAGILSIVLGLIMIFVFANGNMWYISRVAEFGADFYTYIDEATAYAGWNVGRVGVLLGLGFGFLLIVLGLVFIAIFGIKLSDYPKEVKEKIEPEYIFKEETKEIEEDPIEESKENEYIVQPNNFDDEIE